ncbi:MAG TPA: periplasmic heavy metal sensor [Xanthobacteraceae bacterium]|nr:periplasmic heavy metal sensor [Xanthobacteraceae bacterium]
MSEGPLASRAGSWSRWILFVSLALNLFFIGAWAALTWRHYAGAHHGPMTPESRIERLASALPADDAAKLRAQFRAHEADIEAATAAYRLAQRRMREALRAEPFNSDTLRADMVEARAARGKLDATLQDVIASAVATMTPEGRRNLADWTPYRRSGNEKSR